ncbi:hypothetical protein Tco_1287630 [Tanacetum coccineum]
MARNLAVVKSIASRFGKLLEVGRLNPESNVLSPVKTLILTYNMKDIGQPIDIVLNNRTYPYDGHSDGSSFEEEYVGPSIDVHNDVGCHGTSQAHDEDEVNDKAPSHQSAKNGSRVSNVADPKVNSMSRKERGFHSPCPSLNSDSPIGPVNLDPALSSSDVDFVRPIPSSSSSKPILRDHSMPAGSNVRLT